MRERDGPAGHAACLRTRRARPPRALRIAFDGQDHTGGPVMRINALIGVVLLSTFSCTTTIYEPAPEPTLTGLAGVWVGHALDGFEFVRLELTESGSGFLTVETFADRPLAGYEVTKTVIDHYQVTFNITPLGAGAYPMFLRSDRILPWRLTLEIGGTSPDWKHKVMLFPVDNLANSLDRANKRADEMRRHHV